MATLLQLRDQIKIDAGISGHPKFSDSRLDRMINLAQRYVQTNLNGLGMKKWETSDSLTLSAPGSFGGGSVVKSNLSTDCPNMLESPNSIIYIATSDGSTGSIAYEIDIKLFQEQLNNSYLAPTLSKPVFMRLANQIYISPDTVSAATAYYYRAVTDLSSNSASTEIPLEFEEFIIKKVVLEVEDILGKIQEKELKVRQIEKDINATYQKYVGKENEKVKISNNMKLQ